MSNAEDYLQSNVKVILEPLIKKILDERPSDPIPFMINYLQQEYNIKSSQPSKMQELIDLRKQVEEYRKKYEKKDKEMEVSSESEEEVDAEEQKKNR
jgi:hypothetical protein